jgi:hypothetical protein
MSATASRSTAIPSYQRASRRARLLAFGVVAVSLALAIGYSLTRAPWWDEGVYADVAMTFRNHGHLGASTLYPFGYLNLPEANRYTYSQLPLYLVVLGIWWRLVPATVEWMRLFSVLWGCVYIASWYLFVRALSRRESLALFIASVVAFDYYFLFAASDGRMDMMCAALGQAGLASYVYFRESNWTKAMILAGCFGAASLLCHPLGAVTNLAIAAVVLLDWRRFQWKGVAGAAAPYVVGGAACVAYILQAPAVFWAQSKAASEYRVVSWLQIFQNLFNDFYLRYVGLYYSNLSGINRLKAASLLFAVVGVIGVAANRRLRSQPLGKILLILAAVTYLGVAAVDNQKFPVYFVFATPVFTACAALWAWNNWEIGGVRRLVASALLAGSVLSSIGGYSYKIYKDAYGHLYRPAVNAIKANLPPNGLVMGGSELGFALGFGPTLVDDRYLGYFSRKTPDVFVESPYYGGMGGPGLRSAWDWSRDTLRTQYHLVLENSAHRVYVRNGASRQTPSAR